MVFEVLFAAALATAAPPEETLVVTATRSERPLRELAGNTGTITDDAIDLTAHTHISELMNRVPGAWITRGSTQEHLTAIRSPILSGPGGCGAFLVLEDGLPVRPAGFCNINQLIELNTEQARSIEVVRGPGSALYGSNALHGLIHVLSPDPHGDAGHQLGLEVGPAGFIRMRTRVTGAGQGTAWTFGGMAVRDDGWRDGSGHDQYKLNARGVRGALDWSLAATDLSQDTAAFIVGQDAYRDESLARGNPSPDAFRDMDSQRVGVRWTTDRPGWSLSMRPYARRSRMTFLQHFIPGQPVEENGHHSLGTQFMARRISPEGGLWVFGADLEYADIFVRQTQSQPLVDASPFLNATRPQGRHYDFEVEAVTLAAYAHGESPLTTNWRLTTGLRLEQTRYDYDNRMPTGNLREDGTACDFGGCHYNRPVDRRDRFTVFTPKVGIVRGIGTTSEVYVSGTRGHRAPQVNELYRLQRGQDVADLSPERLDSMELGSRGFLGATRFDLTLFAMRKRNVVFQDSNGFAVADGRTRHQGIEIALEHPITDTWVATLAGTVARHSWDYDRAIARGETITSGDDVDSAPRHLGSARLAWSPVPKHRVEIEWVKVGGYWLDVANTRRYEGHTLTHLRGRHTVHADWSFAWRLTNLTDRRYAERADFAFGDYRYFPGPGRQLHIGVSYTL